MQFKGFISDMDDTIVEGEKFAFEGVRNLLRKFGKDLEKEDFASHFIGKTMMQDAETIRNNYGINLPPDAISKDIMRSILEVEISNGGLKLKNGYVELLNLLKKRGTKISLASSSPRKKIESVLKSTKIEKFFHAFVSAEDVGGKVNAYRHAVNSLGFKPEECFALEDSPRGALAAKEAGLYCVVIPSEFFIREDFSFADEVHNSIPEFLKNGKIFNGVKP